MVTYVARQIAAQNKVNQEAHRATDRKLIIESIKGKFNQRLLLGYLDAKYTIVDIFEEMTPVVGTRQSLAFVSHAVISGH